MSGKVSKTVARLLVGGTLRMTVVVSGRCWSLATTAACAAPRPAVMEETGVSQVR